MIDLHIHTTYSDGTDTPLEVMEKAEKLKLRQIAITDHNCVRGAIEAAEMKDRFSFEFLTGCELSCDINGKEVHLLGYFNSDRRDFAPLEQAVNDNLEQRIRQHKEIISKLNSLGFKISYRELEKEFPNIIRNRVHIARLMIQKGYAKTVAQVFDKYLKKGCPCYTPKKNIILQDGIDAIHACSGKAVIAHFYEYKQPDISGFLGKNIIESLDGFEVYHPAHNALQRSSLLDFALRYKKLITGGSDYHGSVKPDVDIGCADVPDDCLLKISE